METKYIIEAKDSMPYVVKTDNGCELWSNDRKMHIVISKSTAFDIASNTQQDLYSSVCWVLNEYGWEQGVNSTSVNSVDEYIHELNQSPYFTNAVKEYYECLKK